MAAKQIAIEATSQAILALAQACADYLEVGGTVKRYGVCIDKSDSNPATRCTYLGAARNMVPAHMNFASGEFDYGSWADIWFVTDNKPCMLKQNGEVDYYLDQNDYSLREDGVTASDVANADYDGNAMAQFPLVYFDQYESAGKMYIWACKEKYNEHYKAYAHTREDGSIADYFYWGLFGGSTVNSVMRSLKGNTRTNNQTATTERTLAQANGDGWDIHSWSQRNYFSNLLTLLGCNDDTQAVFGNGNLPGGSSISSVKTTGTLSDKGQFWGASANYTSQVKALHIEAPWGDQWDRVTGYMYSSEGVLVKMTPPYNLTADGYTRTGIKISGTSGGYISKTTMTEYGRFPLTVSGSSSTYEGDVCWFNTSQVNMARVGVGALDSRAMGGLFGVNVNNPASNANWNNGAALLIA